MGIASAIVIAGTCSTGGREWRRSVESGDENNAKVLPGLSKGRVNSSGRIGLNDD